MSIIDDALKKTQTNLEKTQGKETPASKKSPRSTINKTSAPSLNNTKPNQKTPAQTGAPTPKSKDEKTKKPPSKVIPLLFILIGLIIVAFFTFRKSLPKKFTITEKIPFAKSKEIQSLTPTIKPKTKPIAQITYDQNTFILNGTSIIDNKRVALINNDIYNVGDTVNGRKVLVINKKTVILETAEGKQIEIRTGH